MKILLSEAHNWCSASRSKVYADAREGLLSTEKDPHRGNKKVVDTAELERVYGRIHNPEENPAETKKNGDGLHLDDEKLIQSYENRIQDLQKQLDLASERGDSTYKRKVPAIGFNGQASTTDRDANVAARAGAEGKEIYRLAATSDRRAIVPSIQKATCLFFAPL